MLNTPLFINRTQAGEKLAEVIHQQLSQQSRQTGVLAKPIVYALPRGGLPVAVPIAKKLNCPLSIIAAKKISHPENPELAVGAVTASGYVQWMRDGFWSAMSRSQWQEVAVNQALVKAQQTEARFRPFCPQVNLQGATILLVDDGIATGMTIVTAANALAKFAPAQIWICAPVAPLQLMSWLNSACPEAIKRGIEYRVVVLATPERFLSVSNFYVQFPQVETDEALTYLLSLGNRE